MNCLTKFLSHEASMTTKGLKLGNQGRTVKIQKGGRNLE